MNQGVFRSLIVFLAFVPVAAGFAAYFVVNSRKLVAPMAKEIY